MTNPRFWTGAGESPGKAACLAQWAQHFGEDAGAAMRFLRAEGKHAGLYPHPRGGPPMNIVPGGRKGFQAVSCDEWDDDSDAEYVPPIDLTFEEAQAHTFDLSSLGDELCACCGLGPEWAYEGDCLYRVGRCDKGDVYAFLGLSDDAPNLLHRVFERNTPAGCVLVAYETPAIRNCLEAAGVACVPLCECFTADPDKIGGKCGERCKAAWKTGTKKTQPPRKAVHYVVGGRFRIEGDFSKVTALQSREPVWGLQPFTRMIIKVLLLDCNRSGLTSDEIYSRAKAAFEAEYPESLKREKGQEMIPQRASPIQFLRVQRDGHKRPHPLYDELLISGQKPAVYSFDGKVIQCEEE